MYSETDIQSAIDAGILKPETAAALRAHVAAQRRTAPADEEHFRLLDGFNDIFLSLAIVLLLAFPVAMGQGLVVAAAAWALAEYVTRKRRLALPSFVLFVVFASASFLEFLKIAQEAARGPFPENVLHAPTIASAAAAAAAIAYWWRFRLPMAQAATAGFMIAAVALGAATWGGSALVWPLLGAGGLASFAYAMHWDLADRERRTYRADVAFWLHLLSAPLIAHCVFRQIGAFDASNGGWAVAVLMVYAFFAAVALIVDRRAILVSGLGYALVAVAGLLGDVGEGMLAATLLLGGTLLFLGLFWTNVRSALLAYLPEPWRRRLPPAQRQPA